MLRLMRTRTFVLLAVASLTLSTWPIAAEPGTSATVDEGQSDRRPSLEDLKKMGAKTSRFKNSWANEISTEQAQSGLVEFSDEIEPIFEQACFDCHGPGNAEGMIRIDGLDPDLTAGNDVEKWMLVFNVLTKGEMPPPGEGEISDAERSKAVAWLSSELQVASRVRRREGGQSSFRRMTRYEYNYALQDLLGLPWSFADDLPPEANSVDGFQNISTSLHMSVSQFETYYRLARRALTRATVRGDRPQVYHWGVSMKEASRFEWPAQVDQLKKVKEELKDNPAKLHEELVRLQSSFQQPHDRTYYRELSSGRTATASWEYPKAKYAFAPIDDQAEFPESFDHVAVLPGGRRQNLTIELGDQIPDEGIMRVRVRASRTIVAHGRVPSMQLEFGWQASNEGRAVIRVSAEDTPIAASSENPEIYEWYVPLGEIYPRNSVRGESPMGALPSPSEYIRLVNSSASSDDIQIDYVQIDAPVYDQWPPESHNRIFAAGENLEDDRVRAREILNAFMPRAWRQPVEATAVEQKLQLFDALRPNCESFEDTIVEVLAAVLSSPRFLYIVQEQSADADEYPAGRRVLPAHELAVRLSMFLWCSIPDDELLALAANGELLETETLAIQVERMLADTRSRRFSKHFVHQWLNLELLDFLDFRQHNRRFDPLLKEAMQYEPVALFEEILYNGESMLNFLHCNYLMANERLAEHYGIQGVHGNEFQRVPLDGGFKQGGLLTQAGLLAMNSDWPDSHPLKRGVWLLECLLNDPPPPPPPAVPQIDLADPEIAKMTLKERLEDHRNQAACMACHAKIDPWGIAFENYDAVGKWRDQIDGKPVDASSDLYNYETLDGMDGLKRFLLENRQDQFVRAMVHKVATYALGRPMTFADRAELDEITAEVRRREDGLGTMIRVLVLSEVFHSK